MLYFFSAKFLILYVYVVSAVYVHLRGKIRHKFMRQLLDHSSVLAPINAIMYLFSAVPNEPFIEREKFPALNVLRDNWQILRDEARKLVEQGYIKASESHDDVAYNAFFRTGWKRFYLKWYGTTLSSAQTLCPKTYALIETIPNIKAAMFALLPAGAKLGDHRDPYAGSLRYHLGLMTPNSEKCFINVDGGSRYWRDGEDFMFDETFVHYAKNETAMDRIVLFCDVERPMRNKIATAFNRFFSNHVMPASAAKNLPTDTRVGCINKVFKYFYTMHQASRRFKKANRKMYYLTKYAAILGVVYLVFFMK